MSNIPKFRAWDKSDCKMISWNRLLNGHNLRNVFMRPEMCVLILMQSTGLKDKNGVEIFEGDIVRWGDTPGWEEATIRIATVKFNPDIQFDSNVGIFNYGQFAYKNTEQFLTVIGNIYENFELLEEKQ